MTIIPTFYTTHEGGHWFHWLAIDDPIDIDEFQRRSPSELVMNYKIIHSFKFTKAVAGFDGRWDCVNGWTS